MVVKEQKRIAGVVCSVYILRSDGKPHLCSTNLSDNGSLPAAGDRAGLYAGAAIGFDERRGGGAGTVIALRSALYEMAPSAAGGELERVRQSFIPSGPAGPVDANGVD